MKPTGPGKGSSEPLLLDVAERSRAKRARYTWRMKPSRVNSEGLSVADAADADGDREDEDDGDKE